MATPKKWACVAYLLLLSCGVSSAHRAINIGKDKAVLVDKPDSLGFGQMGGALGGQMGGGRGGQMGGGLGGQMGGGLGGQMGGGLGGQMGGGLGGQMGGGLGGQMGGGLGGQMGGGLGGMGGGLGGHIGGGLGGQIGGGLGGQIGGGIIGGGFSFNPGFGILVHGIGGTYCTPIHCPVATGQGIGLFFDHGGAANSNVHHNNLKTACVSTEATKSHEQNGNHEIEDKHEQLKTPTDESNRDSELRQAHVIDAMAPQSG